MMLSIGWRRKVIEVKFIRVEVTKANSDIFNQLLNTFNIKKAIDKIQRLSANWGKYVNKKDYHTSRKTGKGNE